MKGLRTYKTAIAMTFALAFLAQQLLHASSYHAFAHNTDKTWAIDIHKALFTVVLVKHLKVKPFKYQLTKKHEPGRAMGKPLIPLFLDYSQHQNYCCYKNNNSGASLLQFICVLLI